MKLEAPQAEHWQTVIPQSGETLQTGIACGGHFITLATQDARVVMRVFNGEGGSGKEVKLPFMGNSWAMGGTPAEDGEIFFNLNNMFHPGGVFRLNLADGQVQPFLAGLCHHGRSVNLPVRSAVLAESDRKRGHAALMETMPRVGTRFGSRPAVRLLGHGKY